jgi:hypothetical protein
LPYFVCYLVVYLVPHLLPCKCKSDGQVAFYPKQETKMMIIALGS